MIFLAVLALYGVAREISSDRRTSAAWLGCFLLSYPSLFILQRANLFSAATSILIIYYMVFLQKGKNTGIAIFLLALAVNIKPNAVIFALGLFLVRDGKVLSRLILFSALSCAVFAASLAVSTALYPAYSIPNFLSALRIWRTMYVVGDLGIAYNSSVFTLLKYIFGYHEYLESSCLLGSLALMLIGFRLYLKRSLNATSFVFVMCAAYMIGTTHSCDYHLLIFFIPLIFLSMEPRGAALSSILCGRNGRSYAVIFVVSCFLLSPKNYIVYYGVSLLVLLNPVVIAAGVVLIYFYSVVSPIAVMRRQAESAQRPGGPTAVFVDQETRLAHMVRPPEWRRLCVINPYFDEVAKHVEGIADYPYMTVDRILESYRDLFYPEFVLPRQEYYFRIEGKALYRHQREDRHGGFPREDLLESALGIFYPVVVHDRCPYAPESPFHDLPVP